MNTVFENLLLGQDTLIHSMVASCFILGLIFMPLSGLLSLSDKGYLFSKTIGIAVTGYLMWMLSTLRILKFQQLYHIQ